MSLIKDINPVRGLSFVEKQAALNALPLGTDLFVAYLKANVINLRKKKPFFTLFVKEGRQA
jgi:hypothetical protein